MASSYSGIGALLARTGRPEDRIEWHCLAFAVRRELGVFATDADVAALAEIYIQLGREVWAGLAAAVLDAAALADLVLTMQGYREIADNE
ncbi:hypothetical protein [Dactylosporangium sp. CA-139066]|uniref:hypothetical protein n=1 Tax=Dactylosporangium sp. CA-139066 TaxID=3239930 RepID=UPI003D8A4B25